MNDAIEIPEGMRHYDLPTREETLEITGKLIHVEDNDQGDRPRWAELRLYRTLNTNPDNEMYGRETWLLYTIGHTMMYHAADGCGKGILLAAADFGEHAEDPDGLEPCPRCRPPEWDQVPGDTPLRLEVTWYTYTPCKDPDALYDALCRKPQCQNCTHRPHRNYECSCGCENYEPAPKVLSVPGRRMWEQARIKDPDIAKAAGPARAPARRVKF